MLNPAVIEFDRQGLTVKFHAAGDAAVRAGLDAIEAARKANGFSGNLHNVGHNSFVQMNDFRRAREIEATFEMSPYIWYPNPIIPDIAKAIGPQRMKRWTPVKDAIDSGALVVPGSDWNVVPSVDPWTAIETLVTRQKPGGGGEALGEAEKTTLQQAFDIFTVNSARHMGNGNKTGSIERGMLADILVLDRNPFKIPVTQIHETKVKLTIINGEIVYKMDAPSGDTNHNRYAVRRRRKCSFPNAEDDVVEKAAAEDLECHKQVIPAFAILARGMFAVENRKLLLFPRSRHDCTAGEAGKTTAGDACLHAR